MFKDKEKAKGKLTWIAWVAGAVAGLAGAVAISCKQAVDLLDKELKKSK